MLIAQNPARTATVTNFRNLPPVPLELRDPNYRPQRGRLKEGLRKAGMPPPKMRWVTWAIHCAVVIYHSHPGRNISKNHRLVILRRYVWFWEQLGPSAVEQRPQDWDRALVLLADSPDGMTEAMLVRVHGVPIDVLVELIDAGLATVMVEKLARPRIEIARLTITPAGREAIG